MYYLNEQKSILHVKVNCSYGHRNSLRLKIQETYFQILRHYKSSQTNHLITHKLFYESESCVFKWTTYFIYNYLSNKEIATSAKIIALHFHLY